jgi:SAM-dependent methyltransferase
MGDRRRAQLVYASKAAVRRARWAVPDILAQASGDSLMPPRALAFVGGGDFERTGQEYLRYFTELGGLEPHHDVLDVGCGIGRMAIPLLSYLQGGSYAGFDVGKEMIRWCKKRISTRREDFEFTWAPVYNRKYNPFGSVAGAEYRFPYPDASFDFVFATSLFTHLTLSDAAHYLAEIKRVLRPGGRCLLTFFILTPESLAEIDAHRVSLDFRHPIEGGRTIDPREPEAATAFDVPALEAMFGDAGLAIRRPIRYGRWANAPEGLAGQDIVIATAGARQ